VGLRVFKFFSQAKQKRISCIPAEVQDGEQYRIKKLNEAGRQIYLIESGLDLPNIRTIGFMVEML